MTIPAIAPPERPPFPEADALVSVALAPVATGVWNGTVVVGLMVFVATTTVPVVGRSGAEAVPVAGLV